MLNALIIDDEQPSRDELKALLLDAPGIEVIGECSNAIEGLTAIHRLRPDVVFLDPPRAGSTPECIAAVNKMKPRRVVYVSCDPETLARDVAAFTRLGWRAAKFCPVDLFPQTRHVETVCLLVK